MEPPIEYINLPKVQHAAEFTLMSYNILADCYCLSSYFPYAQHCNLASANRFPKIIQEIKALNTDIICLQEIDHFQDTFEKPLTELGYKIVYTQKGGGRQDGLLIGYKDTSFEAKNVTILDFDKISDKSSSKKGYLCPIVEMVHKPTGYRFLLACVHLHYEPLLSYLQGSYLLQELSHIYDKKYYQKVGIIICGDFNNGPGSHLIQKCIYKKVDYEKSPLGGELKAIDDMYSHTLSLFSAYAHYYKPLQFTAKQASFINGHPPHTNFVLSFKECIDYILYNEKFAVCQLLKLPKHSELLSEGALPNSQYPSDHLKIMARFQFTSENMKLQYHIYANLRF